jgi:hypothetical protein
VGRESDVGAAAVVLGLLVLCLVLLAWRLRLEERR